MNNLSTPAFEDSQISKHLDRCSQEELDLLDFGVIGFDLAGTVQRYNTFESTAAGLSRTSVLEKDLFTTVAPCMNNYLVAMRFEDAAADAEPLDAIIDYVLTLRMRPVRVKLRLLADPGSSMRYVLVQRKL